MADLSPYYNNADEVLVSTDGVTSGATSFGDLMQEGSTLPDFEILEEALMDGRSLATGASAAYVIRVIQGDTTVQADLVTARDDGSDRYFHFYNRAGSKCFVVGPAKVTAAHERPPVGAPARGSNVIHFNVAGDTPGDFFTVETIT